VISITLGSIYPREENPIPAEENGVWAPEKVWRIWRTEELFSPWCGSNRRTFLPWCGSNRITLPPMVRFKQKNSSSHGAVQTEELFLPWCGSNSRSSFLVTIPSAISRFAEKKIISLSSGKYFSTLFEDILLISGLVN
jgi:hypothetical protein